METVKIDDNPGGGGSKKWIILIAILLIGLGVFGWYIVNSSKDAVEENTSDTNEQEIIQSSDLSFNYEFDQFIYAYGVSFESAANIYSRPTIGGDREEIVDLKSVGDVEFKTFATSAGISQSKSFAYILAEKEIWVGSADTEPVKIYTHEPGNDNLTLTGLVISPDGSLLAFNAVDSANGRAQILTLDSSGGEPNILVDGAVIGPYTFTADNQNLLLGPNIFGAGGALDTPKLVNVSSGEVLDLVDPANDVQYLAFNVSPDGKYFAYVSPTVDENQSSNTPPGYFIGKPYKIMLKNLETNELNEIASFDGEPGPNSFAFTWDSNKFYWAEGPKIMEHNIESGSTINIYETTDDAIDVIYGVSGTQLLAGSKLPDQTYGVYNIDLAAKDREKILETTDSTFPVGILLK